MSSTTETAPTPVLQTFFNTGNPYTAQGQRIVAVKFSDGTISFVDCDRYVDGTITEGSSDYGNDPGAYSVYSDMGPETLERLVRTHYVNGSRYAMGTMEREHAMRVIVNTVRDRMRIADKATRAVEGLRGTFVTLDASTTRERLIYWLMSNDRNGCYSDDDMVAEGWEPMTLEQAWEQVEIAVHEPCDDCGRPATHRSDDGCGVHEYACMDHRTNGVTWTRD